MVYELRVIAAGAAVGRNTVKLYTLGDVELQCATLLGRPTMGP
jgi:hypothetical protein